MLLALVAVLLLAVPEPAPAHPATATAADADLQDDVDVLDVVAAALNDAKTRPVNASRGSEEAEGRAPRRPCECADGQCNCCSGFVMQTLVNLPPRQRGCIKITYDPDDFAFAMALSFNDRVLYKNTISAKNPRPLCVALPRLTEAKMCVKLSNVYFVGRNLHACIDMEGKWQDTQAFQMSFDCIRIGADGVKVVRPEDGSGIAVGVPVNVTPAPEEYDEIPAEQPPEKPTKPSRPSKPKPSKPKPPKPADSPAPVAPVAPAAPAPAPAAPSPAAPAPAAVEQEAAASVSVATPAIAAPTTTVVTQAA
ncbi:Transient receptor potential protein [Frankliniella fusca]|uniref:Transient receptor potential protein n=1 Tax=Frankliniella fusca TaxID=407009 RepID=A0AAE1HLZ8_9NEOP|nr:Transient receptor potential protein [Frankliniella fusca]